MGLFDFLKSKKDASDEPQPAAPATGTQPEAASTEPSGPRYKGSNYSMPPQPAAAPVPPPQPPLIPPMPPVPPFEPVNPLEEILLQAATVPEARPVFYRALLQEPVLVVLHPKEGQEPGEVAPTEGMEIQLQVLNDGKIPVFTSLERIQEGSVDLDSLSYLRLRGIDLFQMVQGADCALNPFSPVGKLLPAPELADLLAGKLTELPEGDIPQDMQVQLSQPGDEYADLVDVLRTFCADKDSVEAAYLAQMHMQNGPESPRLLLAFRSTNNDPAFLQDLGPTVQPILEGKQQALDIMLIDPASEEPINQYFQQTEPIYQK